MKLKDIFICIINHGKLSFWTIHIKIIFLIDNVAVTTQNVLPSRFGPITSFCSSNLQRSALFLRPLLFLSFRHRNKSETLFPLRVFLNRKLFIFLRLRWRNCSTRRCTHKHTSTQALYTHTWQSYLISLPYQHFEAVRTKTHRNTLLDGFILQPYGPEIVVL